jgi:hypothetical protein
VENNPKSHLGKMQERELDNIRATIADCHVIESKKKKEFGLQ